MRHSGEPDTPPHEGPPDLDATAAVPHPDETSPLPDGFTPRVPDGSADDRPGPGGVDDGGSSGPEEWPAAVVREAVGQVPRRLLTEVAGWPAPRGVMREDRRTAPPTP